MLALLAIVASAAAQSYSTLDFEYSADVAEVPSRSLLATLNIGVPPLRKSLMVDFGRHDVEVEACVRKHSYTYDVNDTSDVLLFEEEHLTDSQARASFRFSVLEHCTDVGQLGERFYKNCLGRDCEGVVGLSRSSQFWQVWSAYTLGLDGIKLGRDHPRMIGPGDRQSPVVKCLPDTPGVCDFNALIAGGSPTDVYRVVFHTENSYTYLPEELYEQFTTTNSPIDLLDVRTHRLVFTLDETLLRHTPSAMNAVGSTHRSSSNLFFGQHARRHTTMLAKPWSNDTVISIGNAALARYTLHVDLVDDTMTVEHRLRAEHLPAMTVFVGIVLFMALVRSICLSLYELSWLSSGMPVSCMCESGIGVHLHHGGPREAFANWALAIVVIFLSLFAAAAALPFVDETLDRVLLYGVFLVNWITVSLQAAMPFRFQTLLHQYAVYSHGQFRRVFLYSISLETLAALSLFFVVVGLRQDSMGTVGTVFVALFATFNAWRYAHYWLADGRYSLSLALLVAVDVVGLVAVLAWRVVFDFVLSVSLTAALCAFALMLSEMATNRHANVRMVRALSDAAGKTQ